MRIPLRALTLTLVLGLPVVATAQTAPLRQHTQAYALDSGRHAGQQGRVAEAFREVIEVPGAPWLRLTFSEVFLGSESYLTVTSLLDGAQQRLDATGIAQWYNTSAYFNGDAVEVTLHVAPGDEGVFVRMDEVIVGEHGAPESQCGPTDDRQPSNDPKVGRLLSVGCTGWLIHDDKVISAGHCTQSGATTLQFNVPLSSTFGTLMHPGPEDQYSVDSSSRIYVNGGIGNDWGVFRVFNNTQTGLQPSAVQGDVFFVRQDLTPSPIRITGYGTDSGIYNQTQQTHAGPNAGSSGTTMRYQADTQGGNSGSPVIDDATGHAVGVHTHGGCSTSGSGNNSGTSLFSTAFWNAVGTPPPPFCEQSLTAVLDDNTPSPGQTINFTITVDNNTSPNPARLDLWLVATGPTSRTVPLGSGTVPANATVTRVVPLRIPASAPSGGYNFDLNIGDFSEGEVCDNVTFSVTVSSVASSAPLAAGDRSDDTFASLAPEGDLFAASAASTTTASEVSVTPNPFSGQAQIRYTVSATTDVRLAVYDVLGREVAVLVDGAVEAGQHVATFEASRLAAGTYVYRLVAGSDVQVGRLTLAR